jgi:hypothetical protein
MANVCLLRLVGMLQSHKRLQILHFMSDSPGVLGSESDAELVGGSYLVGAGLCHMLRGYL